MELVELFLALNTQLYNETVKFYNHSKVIAHTQDPTLKRSLCKKIAEHFLNHENLRAFLRNNFTSEHEQYFESLIMSNPLNTMVRIEGDEHLKKIDIFRRCGFIFQIKKDYFAIPDEIFKICFDYFNKNKKEGTAIIGPAQEIREYIATLPPAEYSYKMSKTYLDAHLYFIKYLHLLIARDFTLSERASSLLDESIKETRGRAPMLDTLRKFTDFIPVIGEMKKQRLLPNLFHKAEVMGEPSWLEVNIEKFLKEFVLAQKNELIDILLKKLRPDFYFNIRSIQCRLSDAEPLIKSLLCLGMVEVIYSDQQPVYIKLSPFGEKVYEIMFPTMETVSGDMAAKKKIHKRIAVLTPDFNYITDTPDISQYIKILCFADLVSIDRVYQFSINRESVMRSISLGTNFNDFKSFMQRNVKGDLPENIMATVRDWYMSVVVLFEKKYVLISVSGAPERLAEIEKDEFFTRNIFAKVRANQYLLEPEKVEAAHQYFKDRSLMFIVVNA